MNVASVSTQSYVAGLPEPLRTAQEAVHLPEVQEMARKLATYNLGVYMPHIHDDATGAFAPIPGDVVQVEDGLKVSFRSVDEVGSDDTRSIPVGWVWRDDGVRAAMACTARCVMMGQMHTSGHDST